MIRFKDVKQAVVDKIGCCLSEKSAQDMINKITRLVNKMGCDSVSELKPQQYNEFLKSLNEL